MPGEDVFGSLENRRGQLECTRENSARLARSYGTHVTTGWGEIVAPDPIFFDCTFLNSPAVTSGVVVTSSTGGNDNDADGPLVAGRFPRVTAGVWRWVTDVNDNYTGAYVFFVVETAGFQFTAGTLPSTPEPGYHLTHHLLFEGIAYKDFNPTALDY